MAVQQAEPVLLGDGLGLLFAVNDPGVLDADPLDSPEACMLELCEVLKQAHPREKPDLPVYAFDRALTALRGAAATVEAIEARARDMGERCGEAEATFHLKKGGLLPRVVIAFCGHGKADANGKTVLLLGRRRQISLQQILLQFWDGVQVGRNGRKVSQLSQLLILIDACFSGGAVAPLVADLAAQTKQGGQLRVVIITSTSAVKEAYEPPGEKTLFMQALLSALKGGALAREGSSERGKVTSPSLLTALQLFYIDACVRYPRTVGEKQFPCWMLLSEAGETNLAQFGWSQSCPAHAGYWHAFMRLLIDHPNTMLAQFFDARYGTAHKQIAIIKRLQKVALEQPRKFYVPLNCQASRQDSVVHKSLDETVDKFLSFTQTQCRVCLLLGEAGSGKTTFTELLEKRIWEKYDEGDICIPIRIEMRLFEQIAVDRCIVNAIGSEEDMNTLKKADNQHYLFIFDGLDELKGTDAKIPNIWELNRLNDWARAKIIITCRPEFLVQNSYKLLLCPGEQEQLEEWFLSRMDNIQTAKYLKGVGMDDIVRSECMTCLQEYPSLRELVCTPFLVKIFADAFPTLKDKKRFETLRLNDIYAAFVKEWFKKEAKRALVNAEHGMTKDFEEDFRDFAWELAFALFKDGKSEMEYIPKERRQRAEKRAKRFGLPYSEDPLISSLDEYFDKTDLQNAWKLKGCPLRCMEDSEKQVLKYSFVHLSFMEYFVADFFWMLITKSSTLLIEKFGARFFGKNPRTPVVVGFLVDRVLDSEGTEKSVDRLFDLIAGSRGDDVGSAHQAAASNAITVLNTACTPMSVKEHEEPGFFRGMKVPYADLSMAQFFGVDLTGADLSYCLLAGVKLSGCNLNSCNLTGVHFGQLPWLTFERRIATLALSCTNFTLAVASACKVHVLTKESGKVGWEFSLTLQAGSANVHSVCFSRDGKYLAYGGADKILRLMDTLTGKLRKEVMEMEEIMSVTFSPDGSQILTGYANGKVRLRFSQTLEMKFDLGGSPSHVWCVAFAPDGMHFVSGGADCMLRLWGAKDGLEEKILQKDCGTVTCVAFSSNSKHIAVGSNDWKVRLWNVETGDIIHTLIGHKNGVNSVAFSVDDSLIASGSNDRTIRLWDARLGSLKATLQGHTEAVNSVVFSTDGRLIVSGSSDNTVRLWDLEVHQPGPIVQGHVSPITSVAASPCGDEIASGSTDKTVWLWNATNGFPVAKLTGHTQIVKSVAHSGCHIVSGSNDGKVGIWNASNGSNIKFIEHSSDLVNAVTFSPDGSQIISGSNDKTLRLWDVSTGLLRRVLEGHTGPVNSVTFSLSGEQIASGSGDRSVRLWNISEGELPTVLEGHTGPVNSVTFSPSGEQVASGSEDRSVRLWNVRECRPLYMLEGHLEAVNSVAFSPDSRLILSGSHDKTLRLWHAASGLLSSVLIGHNGVVMSVAFLRRPHECFIISGSGDKTVRLWKKHETSQTLNTYDSYNGKEKIDSLWTTLWSSPPSEVLEMYNVRRTELVGPSEIAEELISKFDCVGKISFCSH